MLHTNLIPYGRCPVHILRKRKKKSTFRNRNWFPFRFREPYDPRRSPIWFPGSFLRRFLPRIQTPHLQTKCRLPLILFSVVLLPVVILLPISSVRWLFLRDIFFPLERKKKCWLLSFAMENGWVTFHFWPLEKKFHLHIPIICRAAFYLWPSTELYRNINT